MESSMERLQMLEELRNLAPANPTRESRDPFLVFEQDRRGYGEFWVHHQESFIDIGTISWPMSHGHDAL